MKKLLRFISLVLIMAMLLPMTPVELFAVEAIENEIQTEEGDVGESLPDTNGEEGEGEDEPEEEVVITPKTDYTTAALYKDASYEEITQRAKLALEKVKNI